MHLSFRGVKLQKKNNLRIDVIHCFHYVLRSSIQNLMREIKSKNKPLFLWPFDWDQLLLFQRPVRKYPCIQKIDSKSIGHLRVCAGLPILSKWSPCRRLSGIREEMARTHSLVPVDWLLLPASASASPPERLLALLTFLIIHLLGCLPFPPHRAQQEAGHPCKHITPQSTPLYVCTHTHTQTGKISWSLLHYCGQT